MFDVEFRFWKFIPVQRKHFRESSVFLFLFFFESQKFHLLISVYILITVFAFCLKFLFYTSLVLLYLSLRNIYVVLCADALIR